jgi:hypothetical protein
MLAAKTIKGAAVRLFKQPSPVLQHYFLQLTGKLPLVLTALTLSMVRVREG